MIKALFSAVYAALLLTLAAAAFAEDSPSAGSSPLPKILIFGDSLSAAYGIGEDEGWVTLLAERLAQEDSELEVVNGSVSGETTTGGRARLPSLLERYNPAFVLIELGGNDGLRGLPPARMQANLASMIEAVEDADAQPVLLGIEIPPNYGPAYTDAFRQVYRDLADEYSVPLVPFILEGIATAPASEKLMQQDRIHPTAKAQPQLLDTIWPTLAPLAQHTASAE